MDPYDRSFDMFKCFTQVRAGGHFPYASLNIWFEHMINYKNLLVVLRDSRSFVNPVAVSIVKIECYLYVEPEIKKKVKEFIASSRYSENVNHWIFF